jgi:hypothetical protein
VAEVFWMDKKSVLCQMVVLESSQKENTLILIFVLGSLVLKVVPILEIRSIN